MSFCPAYANQGFPVVLNGTVSRVDDKFRQIQGEPEIYSAFGTSINFPDRVRQTMNDTQSERRNLIRLPDMKQNTLTYNGEIYNLAHIQVCRSQQSSDWPSNYAGNHNADCVFTYTRASGFDTNIPAAIIAVVSLYEKESMSDISQLTPKAQMYFEDAVAEPSARPAVPRVTSLQAIFSDMGETGYVMYSSCLLLRDSATTTKSMNVVGLYFPSGWILPKALIERLGDYTYNNGNMYAQIYIPTTLRGNRPIAKRQPDAIGSNIPAYITDGNTWSTDGTTFTYTITANSEQFTQRFRYISRGLIGLANSQKRLKTTLDYQCLPLDKMKDVNGQYVMLDPATGKRSLEDTMKGTPNQQKELELTLKVDTSKSFEKAAMWIGIICAIIFVLVVVSFVIRYFLVRQGSGAPSMTPDALGGPEITSP